MACFCLIFRTAVQGFSKGGTTCHDNPLLNQAHAGQDKRHLPSCALFYDALQEEELVCTRSSQANVAMFPVSAMSGNFKAVQLTTLKTFHGNKSRLHYFCFTSNLRDMYKYHVVLLISLYLCYSDLNHIC